MTARKNRRELTAVLAGQLSAEELRRALVHPTYALEHPDAGPSNQRLEFLGDAVVDLVVGEWLFASHPDWPEGELTKARAALVCEASLAEAGQRLGIGEALLLGRGEDATGGRSRPSNLADTFEAVVGALFGAAGYPAAAAFVRAALADVTPAAAARRDWKSALQEQAMALGLPAPVYALRATAGPVHDPCFTVEVACGDRHASGEGRSKKEAEQQAAQRLSQEIGG